jgi:hypothetical protein
MAATDLPQSSVASVLSFNRLGPFYRLQLRLGLLSESHLAAGRRAALFLALAWLPALMLALPQGLALNSQAAGALLLDFSVYAFGLAIVAFMLMEQTSDKRMAWLVSQFVAQGIVRDSARAGFAAARLRMERRTGAAWVEALLLVAAYALAFEWMSLGAARIPGGSWYGQVVDGQLQPTLPGWWTLLVSLPLFWFLLGRWLWRFVTWGLMLRDIARCDLRLVPTHPDRCGGIAFIGQYPKTYLMFVFALSCVVAAGVLKAVVHTGASLLSFKFALFGLVVFLVVAFVLPLFAFTPVLAALKKQGLSRYGALVSQHHLAFEGRWLRGDAGKQGAEALGSPDMSSLADLSAAYDLVSAMRPVPVTKSSIVPLIVVATLPLAGVALTRVPFKAILDSIRGLLFL